MLSRLRSATATLTSIEITRFSSAFPTPTDGCRHSLGWRWKERSPAQPQRCSQRLSKSRTPGSWGSTARPWHVCSWKVRRAATNEPRSRRDIQARSLQRVHTAACPVLAAWSTDPCRAKTEGPTPQRITLPVPSRVGQESEVCNAWRRELTTASCCYGEFGSMATAGATSFSRTACARIGGEARDTLRFALRPPREQASVDFGSFA